MDKVTVIIPSYNHKTFIEESVNSVLNQDYEDIELIVIDDGSKDGSVEILKELSRNKNFILIIKENEGICKTLNRALTIATGKYITFLASDDYMPTERVKEQVHQMHTHPDVDVIAGSICVVDATGKKLSFKSARKKGLIGFEDMIVRNVVFAPTAIFKQEVFKKFGMYNENYLIEDYHMWLKILKGEGKILNVDNMWAFYRLSTGNLEKRFTWYYEGYKQTLTEYIPDPRAIKALQKYALIYSTKMALLKGSIFLKQNKTTINQLKVYHRIALRLATILPEVIRKKILIFLLKEL